MFGVRRNASFYTCHFMISLRYAGRLEAVRQKVLHDLRISIAEDHRAACVADKLVAALDHAMALACSSGHNFAGASDFEPLFSSGLGLHLGHFALLEWWVWQATDPLLTKHNKPPRHALPGGLNGAL